MKKGLFIKTLARMAGVTTAVFAAATSLLGQSSPVGTWDVVLRGEQKGVAHLTFNSDFTIDGTEVIAVKPAPKPDSSNPRGGSSGTSTNSSSGSTNFFGTVPISGMWTYDNSGRLVGFFSENGTETTNGISFRGKVGSQRINLVGHHSGRTLHYRGIPLVAQADISGNYYANGQKDGEPYVEIFNLTPDIEQNRYLVTGTGPDYDFAGVALLSGQKNLAITSIQSIGTNGVGSAVSGPFSISKGRGNLTGVDQLHDRVTSAVRKQ